MYHFTDSINIILPSASVSERVLVHNMSSVEMSLICKTMNVKVKRISKSMVVYPDLFSNKGNRQLGNGPSRFEIRRFHFPRVHDAFGQHQQSRRFLSMPLRVLIFSCLFFNFYQPIRFQELEADQRGSCMASEGENFKDGDYLNLTYFREY